MIHIKPEIISGIKSANFLEDLFPYLQSAIELEHATIPPYLTAMFSFKPGTETDIRGIIHSIVIEEMLHMTIASNILNAIGGSPDINKKDFIPNYACHLPMGIAGQLNVGLEKFSILLVENVFMHIEEPESPIIFNNLMAKEETFNTIGQFYNALRDAIKRLTSSSETLPGNPSKQVTSSFFSSENLFPIINTNDVVKAINIIIEQGEGTATSPLDGEEIAHYYRFQEISKGKQLIKDPHVPNGYSFTGKDISFTADNVYNIFPNTKASMLLKDSEEWRRVNEFNTTYYSLLSGLHRTFNGEPEYLSNTIGVMFDLRLAAEKLCATDFPGKEGKKIGPSFEWN